MNRRDFLKTSLATSASVGLGTASITSAAEAKNPSQREFYELRIYRLNPGSEEKLLHTYLEKALLPAANRLGSSPVGVFTEIEAKNGPAVYVLLPFASMEAYAKVATGLFADPEFQKAGAEYLQLPKTAPAFSRIDSWLMVAFKGMPKLELPSFSKDKKSRMFELRIYESYSEAKAQKKIEMFNDGEIDVMREVGLSPVFYGQTLIGRDLPHLIYMTSAESKEAHKQHWDKFRNHPTWKKLLADPQYADTVSKASPFFLTPTAYSQI